MPELRVLVVGASIAGPATAYWFARAGANVTVIERFKELRTNGQAVDIRSVGVTVMQKIPGMEAAVRAKPVPIEGLSFVGPKGRPYATINRTGNPEEQSLVSEFEILRGDLSRILFDITKDNERIKYIFNEQVASIQQGAHDKGPVRVEFLNGSPTAEFDLVVACDGATSRTRAIGLGCNVREYIHPTNCWAAYFSLKGDLLRKGNMGHAYSAPSGRWVAIGSDPTGGNLATFMKYSVGDENTVMGPFREALKQGNDAVKEYVSTTYQGAGWMCDEIIQGMMNTDDFYASEIVKVRLPSLYKGRFVLVGDAGYAGAAGAGTSLALVGAYVLAGEIKRHQGNLAAGLKGYNERMRPMIDDLQQTPPLLSTIMAPQTAWGIWLRNALFGFVCWSGIAGLAHRLFAGVFSAGDRYHLPDYEKD
ncbi:oxidoreductase [Aspergillus pseudoustus]|uniref:Oxidoreductase n=1 Tax=Aspergillus pseudoustus TaxID=1810923 RepID=A0ABR4JHY7_9EURO